MLFSAGVALVGGCYAPDFGDAHTAPFRCGDGRCPEGYRCAALGVEATCVPEDAKEPPIALGRIDLEHAPPHVFWTEGGATVIWQLRDAPQLYAATWDGVVLKQLPWKGFAARGNIAFAARYHAGARRVVVAWEDRLPRGARLSLASLSADFADADAVDPAHVVVDERPLPLEGFGFSRPGLAVTGAGDVVLAYTFGSPPQVVGDNVYCERISLLDGTRDPACRPPVAHTAGAYAVDALPLVGDDATLTVWRDAQVHVSALAARGFRPRIDLPLGQLAAAVLHEQRAVLLARPRDAAGQQGGWRVLLVSAEQLETVDLQRMGSVIPGLALDAGRARAVVCMPTMDNRLELRSFALPSLAASGTLEVPRLSHAPVFDCQVAVSPVDGRVALAWREAATVQAFATIVSLP
jgi:hypothetical protein